MIKIITILIVVVFVIMNAIKIIMKIMKPYSIRKISLIVSLIISKLKPDTNSLSLSMNSNGARFISPKIISMKNINIVMLNISLVEFISSIIIKAVELHIYMIVVNIKVKPIS